MKTLAGQAASVLARVGLLGALEYADRATDRVSILAYHRIDELDAEPDLDPALLSATPQDFRAQMEVISAHYSAISLEEFVAAHIEGRTLPRRAVLLTFDDGYQDFAARAWPILKSLGLPATLFVPTDFPDTPGPGFWWDRLYSAITRTKQERVDVESIGEVQLADTAERQAAHRVLKIHAKSLPHAVALEWIENLIDQLAEVPPLHRVLGWDALREMADEGLSVCSHGNIHALCTRLSSSELVEDLSVSKTRIERELGDAAPPPVIAYPASACDETVFEAVRSVGYQIAFGGRRGVARLPFAEPFDLMRMPVHRYDTALFRAQLRPSVSRLGRMLID
jgi:peptidoglycan/xylan/chitin deacetylase (PgdA/CDA1 family)